MAAYDPVARCAAILRDRLAPILAPARTAALIGFPENQNCGDHANWLGALRLLSELGLEVAYTSSWPALNREQLASRLGNGVVLLSSTLFSGGESASRAAELVGSLPNRIVVLPEAVPPGNRIAQPLATAISNHPDLIILARDGAARKAIDQTFGGTRRVELAPPLSFILGPQQPKTDPQYDMVWLARTGRRDSSVEAAARLLSQSAEKLDLPEFPDGLDIDVVVKRRPPTVMLTDWSSLVFRSQEARLACNALDLPIRAQAYAGRGLHILSLGRLAITDRTGAHIMCLLLRLPHIFADDGTGANRAFFESWSKDAESCRFAETPARAWSQARSLLRAIKGE